MVELPVFIRYTDEYFTSSWMLATLVKSANKQSDLDQETFHENLSDGVKKDIV